MFMFDNGKNDGGNIRSVLPTTIAYCQPSKSLRRPHFDVRLVI